MGAKDLLIRVEGKCRAAPIGGCADLFDPALGDAAREALFKKLFVAGHLHDN